MYLKECTYIERNRIYISQLKIEMKCSLICTLTITISLQTAQVLNMTLMLTAQKSLFTKCPRGPITTTRKPNNTAVSLIKIILSLIYT